MKLREIMSRSPQTVCSGDLLTHARDLMLWGNFRHVPVVDDDTLVGVLSERDVATFQARTGESLASSPDATVGMAMEPNVAVASLDDTVVDAAARMAAQKIGCLPIIDGGKLVGVVTTTDMLTTQMNQESNANRPNGPLVREIMSRAPETVHPDDTLLNAAARMHSQSIRHLPVIDGENRVIGMLSDRDVRTAIGDPTRALSPNEKQQASSLRVRDVMTSPVVTAAADSPCNTAAQSFVDWTVSAIPVVDGNDRLQGIVSYVDVLRAYLK